MDILIDTNSIRAKATELERLMKELDRKNDSLDKIKKQLDYEVKCKSNISNSISNIKMRIIGLVFAALSPVGLTRERSGHH